MKILSAKTGSVAANSVGAMLVTAIFALGGMQIAAARQDTTVNPLATNDQRELDALALRIYRSPQVQEQKRQARELFLADPAAKLADGRSTLEQALEEMVFSAILIVANGDPNHPKIAWTATPPHTWFGKQVPGSRFALDNPDNIYRFIPIDGVSKYEIRARRHDPGAVQFSFLLYDLLPGVGKKSADQPLSGLRDQDIKIAPDGSFTIVIDSDPANGRVNHLRSAPEAKYLLIRDSLSDWSTQTANTLQIRRIAGPAAAPLTDSELIERTVALLPTFVPTWLAFNNSYIAAQPANEIKPPIARGGSWGFVTQGRFKLADDEGLSVTVSPLGAKYVGFQLGDPWLVSREYARRTGSLTNIQAKPNADGTYTYVIAARDPGIHNWLDTSGLHEGALLLRWQALPASQTAADGALQEVKVVKLDTLKSEPAFRNQLIDARQRSKQIAQRSAGYARRLQTGAADGG